MSPPSAFNVEFCLYIICRSQHGRVSWSLISHTTTATCSASFIEQYVDHNSCWDSGQKSRCIVPPMHCYLAHTCPITLISISLDLGIHQDWEWGCVHISTCATLRLHSNSLILRLRQDQECNSLILCFAFPESHANFGLPRTLDLIRNTSLLPDHSSCQG